MNKKNIIGIIVSTVVVVAMVGIGSWMLFQRSAEETDGNKLGVEWYDVNGKEFVITTADELYELSELSNYYDFKNQTIKLGADIVVNEGNSKDWEKKAPSRKWSPITGFGGVFDGQGHTISGLYAKGYDAAVALFSNTMSGATIQNFKLTNSYFESAGFGGVASISSNGGGKFKKIYSDAILNVVGTYSGFAGGICSKLNLQSSLEECWFDGVIHTTGRDAGGILDDVLGSRVSISHCLFSGEINSAWDFSGSRTGGIVGRIAEEGAGLVLNDCLSTGVIHAASIYYTGSVIGTTTKNTSLTTTNSYGSMGSYDVAIGRSGLSGTINSYPIELYARELVGTKAYQWTNLDFNKYWAIVEEDTPILKCFAENAPSVAGLEKAFDTSWYTEGASEYVITDRADLYGLYMLSASNTFSGKTIKVGSDIVINEGKAKDWAKSEPENVWYPIMKFSGTFDGQGHTISGLYLNTAAEKAGFFKETMPTAIIKNMKLTNSYLVSTSTTNAFLGSISGRGGGTFDTIYSNAIMVSHGSVVGGIFAQVNTEAKNSFTNCWFDGAITMKGETARYVGGVVGGVVKGNTTIAHCLNTAPISQLDFKDAGMFVGGIVGYIINDKTVGMISDCLNTGKISVNYHVCVGSVVGRLNQAVVTISDTYATNESYTYEDGNFRGIGTSSKGYTGGVANFPESYLTGIGGYQWSTLNFKDYWTVVTGPDSTPILKAFANKVPSVAGVARKLDLSWYSVDKKSFVLKDLEDLYGFYAVSGFDTFYEDTVKLGADIVVNTGNASDWTQVAPANPWFTIHNFKGTFDGQGHTISGVYLKTDETYSGFFSKTTKESTVKNLKLTNSYFENTIADEMAAFGSIAGQMGGVLDTVYSDAIVVGKGTQIGGLVGRVNHGALEKYKMTNCWFDGSVKVHNTTATTAYIGGLSGGLIQGYLDMDNCLNSGTVTYTFDKLPLREDGSTHYIGTHVGGLLGGVMNGTAYNKDKTLKRVSEWNVTDCLNSGLISAGMADGSEMNGERFANGAGSILGYTTAGTVNFKNVYATTESCTKRTTSKGKKAVVSGSVMKVSEDVISGIKGYQLTELDFNKYWAALVNPDETPVLKSFANGANLDGVKKLADLSWYDKDAKSYILDSMEDLYGFAMISIVDNFNNKTVKLGKNITVNEGDASTWATSAAANEWIPISSFAGTFDGNGKTISGLCLKTEDSYAGLFARTTNTSTIKNLSIKNSYFENTNADAVALGSVAGQMGGILDTVYSDAIIVAAGTQVGGLVGRANQSKDMEYKITNCWFDGKVNITNEIAQLAYVGGLVGGSIQGTLHMDNCLNTGEISYTYGQMPEGKERTGVAVGGLVGGVMNGVRKDTKKGTPSKLNVTESLNVGIVHAQTAAGTEHPYNDGVRSIVGFTTDGTVMIANDVYASSESAIGIINFNDKRATVINNATILSESSLIGTKGYSYTLLDFDKYWSARSKETPVLKSFGGAGVDCSKVWKMDVDWDGKGTKLRPYIIATIGELFGFANAVNVGNDFEGTYFKLDANIDINKGWTASAVVPDYVWIPISKFAGTFDGNDKTISGLYLKTEESYAGLFAQTTNTSTIKNLSIKNSYFETAYTSESIAALGSVAGQMGGTLDTVYSDAIVVGKGTKTGDSYKNGAQIGGLVGRTNQSKTSNYKMTDCWFDGSVTVTDDVAQYAYVAGLVGTNVQGILKMDNCLNTGTVSYQYDKLPLKDGADWGIGVQVGGIIGGVMNGVKKDTEKGTTSEVYITDCMNGKQVVSGLKDGTKLANGAGSIFGYTTDGTIVMDNVYAVSYCDTDVNVITATKGGNGKQSTVKGAITTNDKATLIGTRGYTYTTLDFTEHWKARTSEIPAIKAFVTDKVDMSAAWRPDTSWYNDKDESFEIETIGELYGFAQLVNDGNDFAGKTVKLNPKEGVIDINPGWTAGSGEPTNVWTPIGTSKDNPFCGEFQGNGNTIRGIYLKTENQYAGLFGFVDNKKNEETACLITNFRLENSYFESTRTDWVRLGSIVGQMGANLTYVYSNAIVKSSASQVGGLVGAANSQSKTSKANMAITNCWFDAGQGTATGYVETTGSENVNVGGLVGTVVQGTLTMTNCLNSAPVTNKTTGADGYTAGLVGNLMNASATLNINDSVNAGTVTCDSANYVASVVGGSKNTAKVKFDNVYTTKQSIANGYYELGNVNKAEKITDSEDVHVYDKKCLIGMNGYLFTELDFTENWAVRANNVPSLKHFEDEKIAVKGQKININWYDENTKNPSVMSIETTEELFGFAWLVNNGITFEDQTVQLKESIPVDKDVLWTPIGSDSSNYFAGTFDGNNKEISGLNVNATSGAAGLFGYTVNCTVRDLDIKDSQMTTTGEYLGSIVGYGSGTFDNVHSKAKLVSSQSNVGGLVGCSTGCNITSCSFDGEIKSTYDTDESARVGGLVGFANQGTTSIANCLYSGDITCADITTQVGGVLGSDNGDDTSVVITNCLVIGSINETSSSVSVVGKVSATTTMTHVYDSADDVANLNQNVKENNSDQTKTPWYVWVQEDGKTALGDTTDLNLIDTTPDTNWYDPSDSSKGTESNPYWIEDAGDLYGLAELVNDGTTFDDKVIKLKNSIIVNEGDAKKWAESEANKPINDNWTPIGNGVNAFQGIFDGQGYEITGLYLNTDRNYVGLFGYTVDSTIKNVSLKNTYFKTTAKTNLGANTVKNYALMGSFVGHGEGVLENLYSDAILEAPSGQAKDYGGQIGGIVGRVQHAVSSTTTDTSCTITNCWFAGKIITNITGRAYMGGLVGMQVYGDLSISNSLMSGDIICSGTEERLGGIVGNDNYYADTDVTVRNTVVAGTITGATKKGAVIGYTGKQTTVEENVYVSSTYTIDISGELKGNASLIKAVKTDFTANGKLADTLYALNTNVNANPTWDSWIPRDGKPVLSQFAEEVKIINISADTSWLDYGDGTEANPYLIMDAADLYGLVCLVNNETAFHTDDYLQTVIKLACDITMNNGVWSEWLTSGGASNVWTPIGTSTGSKSFRGIFDGNNRTISGLYLNNDGTHIGLFGNVKDSTIKNLSITNSYFESSNTGSVNMGSFVGYGDGRFENLYSDAILVSDGQRIGGIIGAVQDGTGTKNTYATLTCATINNCCYDGKIQISRTASGSDGGTYSGGIIGFVLHGSDNSMTDCLFTGEISYTNSCSPSKSTGTRIGIGGLCGASNKNTFTIEDCLSTGVIKVMFTGANASNVVPERLGSLIGSADTKTPIIKGYVYTTNQGYVGSNPSSIGTIGKGTFDTTTHGGVVGAVDVGTTSIVTDLNGSTGTAWIANTSATQNKYKVVLESLKHIIAR